MIFKLFIVMLNKQYQYFTVFHFSNSLVNCNFQKKIILVVGEFFDEHPKFTRKYKCRSSTKLFEIE